MASSAKNLEPAFQGAGQGVGMEIWRIENFQPVPLPKSSYGKFYSGDSYIVLQTTAGKGGAYLFDIHFWLGKDTSQDEAGTAAIKTVELDAVLGGRAVQHRELQGYESDKFLSMFKPCIIPLEGGVASGFKTPEEEKFETRMYICRGKRVVRVKQVPFARSSLNHDDVFILDTENKIYQFNGANSNIQERAKALEVIQHLKEKYHEGKCDVAIIDDGKLEAESGSGEFWVFLGGFAPIGRKVVSDDDVTPETTAGVLYSINDGQLQLEDGALNKAMLENNKCYLLDCGAEIFVWVGRITQVEERKSACKAAEDFITNENRPKTTRITRVIQGYEPQSFKSNFESWPAGTGTGTSGGEEGRGKVAALLKQQGVDIKGASKGSPVNEEIPPLLEGSGKLEVWRINGSAKTPIPTEDIGKFYSGDCYIVLYTYHSGEKKEDYFLSCWMGKHSVQDDQMMATRLANTMCNSLKGRPVQGRIFQGKEPPQFIALFQPMVVLKGGVSTGYKKYIAENNLTDDTYSSEGIALVRISGTSVHNNKAVQVDAVATSLCSGDCFLLQSGNTVFNWHGTSSTFEQQQWSGKVAGLLKPGAVLKHAKEGTESSAFWFALGGKQAFTTKKVTQDTVRDPHLYTYSIKRGKFEVSEVFNFCQDDLLTEDIMILDTHAEVFVWIGHSVDSKEKQSAFDIGQKYIDFAVAVEGLYPDVPLFKVTEGNEPCFFTTYFSWDGTKAIVHGNSFQKKLSVLFGTLAHGSESNDKSSNSNHGGPTQRASALAALSSAFNPSNTSNDKPSNSNHGGHTQRASALAALSSAFNPSSPSNTSKDKNYSSTGEYTQRAEALAALSSAFNPSSRTPPPPPRPTRSTQGSQRAAAVAALSTVLTAEQKKEQAEANKGRLSRGSSLDSLVTDEMNPENASSEMRDPAESSDIGDSLEISAEGSTGEGETASENNETEPEGKDDSQLPDENEGGEQTFSYERLRASSSKPVRGIDYKRREAYLSDDEFQTVFGMSKEAFYKQPKWKQDMLKRKLDLF